MSADPSPGTGRRILVVEDEYLIAEYITATLEDLGYEVVGPAPTVPAAIAAIASERMDAVLLDANLAGTSSAPIAGELAARRIPFVVVTGYGNLDLATALLQSAPRINKPFTPSDIGAILVKILAQ
ncbi:response regulator [Bosea vestrisii]|uniref:response regulator n=1 Tax=Bosea vestrisii TaxID=151416 RepID=UPI0024DFE2A1|nr:response regulator [Bosea vestrisii]WID98822.1 response regulator [Bosea vestrisii]